MKVRYIIGLAVSLAALSACDGRRPGYPYDFKPYIQNEQHALPEAYPDQVWSYPAGTSPQAITESWKKAELIMKVYDTMWRKETRVEVGPQFYNLPASGQRGLATAVANMYSINNYLLYDYYRKRPVGVYTPTGLHLY